MKMGQECPLCQGERSEERKRPGFPSFPRVKQFELSFGSNEVWSATVEPTESCPRPREQRAESREISNRISCIDQQTNEPLVFSS